MDRAFKQFAKYLEKYYRVQFDRKEGFVICPVCGGATLRLRLDGSRFL